MNILLLSYQWQQVEGEKDYSEMICVISSKKFPSHGKNVKIKMKIHRFEKRKRKSIIVSHYFDLNLVEEKGVER